MMRMEPFGNYVHPIIMNLIYRLVMRQTTLSRSEISKDILALVETRYYLISVIRISLSAWEEFEGATNST